MFPCDTAPYFRLPHLGPDCSTPRSARLRQRRFEMAYEGRAEPPEYARLADEARTICLSHEAEDPGLARALALRHVVEHCAITPRPDTLLLGGEDPFLFNLLLPALQADAHSRVGQTAPDEASGKLREALVYMGACFEGHITPGLDDVLSQGIQGIAGRITDRLVALGPAGPEPDPKRQFLQAALLSCESVLEYARRYREAALRLAEAVEDPAWAADLRLGAAVLSRVPEHPARTLHEALQAYWIVYILVTVEMGGCCPGGGLGLGRMDQYLYPYYERDLREGRLTRDQALELLELFLLCFRHVDYYTGHQIFTPGSQASLGGVTPAGADASNDLAELLMEASLRIAMPAPYLSLRLHREAPERYWIAAANYVAGGLGFPIVNDEVLVPAFLKHGRSLEDARDYICSCCYENTVPGREAFHPNGCYLNLPFVLELALNEGRSLLGQQALGLPTPALEDMADFDAVLEAFHRQLQFVCGRLVALVNAVDASHMQRRGYPLMSAFIDDCLARGRDVCAGGAHYNLTGCIVSGLPNVVNSLAAIRECVFERKLCTMAELAQALREDFAGREELRQQLVLAPKWGNGEARVDRFAGQVAEALYAQFQGCENPRGGRWQLALYSFAANHVLGARVGASADGRRAGQSLTRNLDPTWGTDRHGPTGVLRSLSAIDFTGFPDGSSLDLSFDPGPLASPEGREKFAAFLKTFVDLGVMTMQISMVTTETLLDAQAHPERYPNLMVKVAGYSARFVDIPAEEQRELTGRATQRLG